MEKIKLVVLGYAAVMVLLTVWGFYIDPGFASFFSSLSFREPWPLTVTLDFVLGLLLFSIVIYLIEGSARKAVCWGVLMFLMGNIISAIYLLLNMDKIRTRLGSRA